MMNGSLQPASLDDLDRRILRVLQSHADISQAELAERVAASPASCWRRIRSLEARGVLRDTVRLVDPVAAGRALNVLCQVRMSSHQTDARQQFERFVQTHEQIMECHSMSGEWDYLLLVVVESVRDYEALLMGEILKHPAVATSASHFSLKRVKYTTALPI